MAKKINSYPTVIFIIFSILFTLNMKVNAEENEQVEDLIISEMKLDKAIIEAGGTVDLLIKTENNYDVYYIDVTFVNEKTEKEITVHLAQEDSQDRYSGYYWNLTYGEMDYLGDYIPTKVEYIKNRKRFSNGISEELKDTSSFELIENFSSKPVFDSSTFNLSKPSGNHGESIDISVKALSNSNVDTLSLEFSNGVSSTSHYLKYNESSKSFEGSIYLKSDLSAGHYSLIEVKQIPAHDKEYTNDYVYRNAIYTDGSRENIEVNFNLNAREEPYVKVVEQRKNNSEWNDSTTYLEDLDNWYSFTFKDPLVGFKFDVKNPSDLEFEYSFLTKNLGWTEWTKNHTMFKTDSDDEILGFKARFLENQDKYDLIYNLYFNDEKAVDDSLEMTDSFHSEWGKNGQMVGLTNSELKLREFAISIAPKNHSIPSLGDERFIDKNAGIQYSTHVQSYGWQEPVSDGEISGTEGQAKRLEGIKIGLNNPDDSRGIRYRTHVEKYGWMDWVESHELSGTTGEAKRLEAIEIELTDDLKNTHDIIYRVHSEKFGWLGWAANGEPAGTSNFRYRLEAIEIKLLEKSESNLGDYIRPSKPAYVKIGLSPAINYETHVEFYGWQNNVSNGMTSGTVGEAKRLEGIKVSLFNYGVGKILGVDYKTHVQSYGWMDWKSDGEVSGTEGESKRLEAIQIKLDNNTSLAKHFDIYYRVHVEKLGWLDWAKNGESAGSSGYAYRLEGIQIKLIKKNYEAPGSTKLPYVSKY